MAEILVVDDCSTDNTLEIVKNVTDPRVRSLKTPYNMGPSGARNVGIREARADWVAFQDSDDEWLPEKLERQMNRVSNDEKDWVAVYCGMVVVEPLPQDDQTRHRVRYIPDPRWTDIEGDIHTRLLETSLISTQMLVVKRNEIEAIGAFD